MPRLSIANDRRSPDHNENDSIDLCRKCAPTIKTGKDIVSKGIVSEIVLDEKLTLTDLESDACELVKGGCEHPSYSEDEYHCALCNCALTTKDN